MQKLASIFGLAVVLFYAGCQEQKLLEPEAVDGVIAFSRLSGDYWQIWTIRPDGIGARQITSSPYDKRYPVWSSEGGSIYFRTNNNTVSTVDIKSGKEKQILAGFGLVGGVVPSPDGQRLLLVRYDSELKDCSNLWSTSLEGRESKILTRDTGLQHEPCWSADGQRIVYISSHGYRTSEIYMIDAFGGNNVRLTENNAREAWPVLSPVSSEICYCSEISGDYEIWVMDIDGSNRRQLTFSDGIDTRPYYSPDGEKIIFASSRSGVLQLWIMNVDGTNVRQLTNGAPSMDPVWRWY